MPNLVLHPDTEQQLRSLISEPQQAILISAPKGAGKGSVVRWLAANLLETSHEKVMEHPYLTIISRGKEKSISIESVRTLEHILSLRVPNTSLTNRVVIIEDAHTLTHEAQNALLKTLEEPPMGTVVVLTAANEQSLLPTVRSRLSRVILRMPTQADLANHFSNSNFMSDKIEQASTISGGMPGLMTALLADEDHELMPAISKARELLGMSQYERLIQVDILAKDRELTDNTLFILQHMSEVQLRRTAATNAERWSRVLQACFEADQALAKSGQTKLVLSHLMLILS